MPLEENKALARRAIDEIWSKGNLAVGPDIYSPNFLSHQHSHPDIGDVRGLSALIEFVREFREAFPDFHDTIDDQVAEGDKVVTRFTSTDTSRNLNGLAANEQTGVLDGHCHRPHRGRQNRRGVGQLGSVRNDATVGRHPVTSGSLFAIHQLQDTPATGVRSGIPNCRATRADSLLTANNLVNTSDSRSASDILIDKIKLAIGVFS